MEYKPNVIKCQSPNMVLINDTVTNDVRLSDAEVGLFTRISSYPDNWHLSVNGLVKIRAGNRGKDGVTATRKRLQNLERYGYLIRGQVRNKNGTMSSDTVYIVVGDPENIYGAVVDDLKKANILIISAPPESFEHERSFICNYRKSGAATTAPEFFGMPPTDQGEDEEIPGRNRSGKNGISAVTWKNADYNDVTVEFGWKEGWKDGGKEEEVFHSEIDETQNPRSQPMRQIADVGETSHDSTIIRDSPKPITLPSIHPSNNKEDLSGSNRAASLREEPSSPAADTDPAGRTDGWMGQRAEGHETPTVQPINAIEADGARADARPEPEPRETRPGEGQAEPQRRRPFFTAFGFGGRKQASSPEEPRERESQPEAAPAPTAQTAPRREGIENRSRAEPQPQTAETPDFTEARTASSAVYPTSTANDGGTERGQQSAQETAKRMMAVSVNRNRLRNEADINEITRRVEEISERGHSLEDIEGAWNDVQERLMAEGRQERFFPQLLKWLAYDAIQEIRKRERSVFEKAKSGKDKANLAIRYASLVEDDPLMAELDTRAHALASEARYDQTRLEEARAAKDAAWEYFYATDGQR